MEMHEGDLIPLNVLLNTLFWLAKLLCDNKMLREDTLQKRWQLVECQLITCRFIQLFLDSSICIELRAAEFRYRRELLGCPKEWRAYSMRDD